MKPKRWAKLKAARLVDTFDMSWEDAKRRAGRDVGLQNTDRSKMLEPEDF